MTDNERITRLEEQMDVLEKQYSELYRQLAEARLDQWKARLEDLEIQAHLGAMDTNDRVAALVQKARDRWNDARTHVGGTSAAAGEMLETLRGGVENALDDLRRAILDAKSRATGS
jgi:hypothetical protein